MSFLKILLKKDMIVTLLLGFSGGMPLLLTSKTLQGWMATEGVNLTVIGLFALVGLPYNFKFVWAPLMDRFVPPFLGRRRGWLILCQMAVLATLALLASSSPKDNPGFVAFICLLVCFFSASQDIVIDAFRRELLKDEELGLGSTLYIYGYRIAMWITGGLAFIMADHMSWSQVYYVMAAGMLIGIATTLWTHEPNVESPPPRNLKEAVIDPLVDFFQRQQVVQILLFILLYKFGDTMAGSMATPLYKSLGFSNTEIGAIAKTFGPIAVLVGGFVGGASIIKLGIYRSLFIFGVLQAASTLGFALLANVGLNQTIFAGVVFFEDFSGGMGTAAYAAYMASLTNKKFTATQYALLTSIMGLPRTLFASSSGYLVEQMGYAPYFLACAAIAIPGLLLIMKIAKPNRVN